MLSAASQLVLRPSKLVAWELCEVVVVVNLLVFFDEVGCGMIDGIASD